MIPTGVHNLCQTSIKKQGNGVSSIFHSEIIGCVDGIVALKSEWRDLLKRSKCDNLFVTPEWALAWLNAQLNVPRLKLIAARQSDGKLVGILPMFFRTYRLFGALDVTIALPLGSTNSGAEYQGVIVDESSREKILWELGVALSTIAEGADLFWFPNISAWNSASNNLKCIFQAASLPYRTRSLAFSSVLLPDSFMEFLSSQSQSRRQRIRRFLREGEDESRYTFSRIADPDILEESITALISLHTRRWRCIGQSGSFVKRPELVGFYKRFTAVALREDWLRLYQMHDRGRLVATQIGYVYRSVFYQLQEAFDPDEPGAGNILRAQVLKKTIEEGVREYDFLGGITEHKARWGARRRVGESILAAGKSVLGRTILTIGIWPTGKYLRPIV